MRSSPDNASSGDVAPVFDTILEKAMRLCEADFGVLNTFDGERMRKAAMRGVPAAYAASRARDPRDYGPESGPARILAGELIVHVADMKDSDLYRDGDPYRRAIVDLGGARSYLTIGLRKGTELLGSVAICRNAIAHCGP